MLDYNNLQLLVPFSSSSQFRSLSPFSQYKNRCLSYGLLYKLRRYFMSFGRRESLLNPALLQCKHEEGARGTCHRGGRCIKHVAFPVTGPVQVGRPQDVHAIMCADKGRLLNHWRCGIAGRTGRGAYTRCGRRVAGWAGGGGCRGRSCSRGSCRCGRRCSCCGSRFRFGARWASCILFGTRTRSRGCVTGRAGSRSGRWIGFWTVAWSCSCFTFATIVAINSAVIRFALGWGSGLTGPVPVPEWNAVSLSLQEEPGIRATAASSILVQCLAFPVVDRIVGVAPQATRQLSLGPTSRATLRRNI